jgi:ribonuclease BN (tRNA processing enzyme)
MNLTVLGSGTGAIRLERGSAGYLLKAGKYLFLIDSGPGTLTRILKAGYALNQIDALFYTHIHPDHISDLVPFLFSSKYSHPKRRKKLLIAGGTGFWDFFAQLSDVYRGWLTPKSFQLQVIEMDPRRKIRMGSIDIACSHVNHIPESAAYRFEYQGKSVVFSGDTDMSPDLVQLSRHADVLILECSFPDRKRVKGHLTPQSAGKMASEAHPRLLLLSHFYPPCDRINLRAQIQKSYSGRFRLAHDGLKLKI